MAWVGLLLVEAEQVAGRDGGAERAVGGAGAEALLVAARDEVGRHGRLDLVAGGDRGDQVAPALAARLGDGQRGGTIMTPGWLPVW